MPFFDRDEKGRVVAVYEQQQREGQEYSEQPVELADLRSYKDKRAVEYSTHIGDGNQMDIIWKELAARGEFVTQEAADIYDQRQAIKAKYPKEQL
jgi:hypothetical protein